MSINTERIGIDNIPRRGRPLSPGYEEAILEATLRLMARDGYSRMSMDAIAGEVGGVVGAHNEVDRSLDVDPLPQPRSLQDSAKAVTPR